MTTYAFDNSNECVVERMFTNYTIIRNYPVMDYHVEFYIPELNFVVEYEDEDHNSTKANAEASAIREAEIKRHLNCTFIRVPH